MKKINFLGLIGMITLASCSSKTFYRTATTTAIENPVKAEVEADLDVSPTKITYTMRPSKEVRNGGYKNVLNTAVREALEKNGGGDVLVEMQVTSEYKSGVFGGKKVKSVTVSGYPGVYKNFRSVK